MRLIAPTSMAVPEHAKVLQELPHRLGGLGAPEIMTILPHARAAMITGCSPVVDGWLGTEAGEGEEQVKYVPQRGLLRPVWDAMHLALITSSTALEIASVVEASSPSNLEAHVQLACGTYTIEGGVQGRVRPAAISAHHLLPANPN